MRSAAPLQSAQCSLNYLIFRLPSYNLPKRSGGGLVVGFRFAQPNLRPARKFGGGLPMRRQIANFIREGLRNPDATRERLPIPFPRSRVGTHPQDAPASLCFC
jgi:hypothetical protein